MNAKTKLHVAVASLILAVVSASATAGTAQETATISNSSVGASQINPVALAAAQQKLVSAQQIAERFAAQAQAQALPEQWRYDLINNLMLGDELGFTQTQAAVDIDQARASALAGLQRKKSAQNSASSAVATDTEAKSLGTSTADLTYVPITPCRILDTRAGTPIPGGTSRTYSYTTNTGGGSCNVALLIGGYPALAYQPSAIAANITVVQTGLGTIGTGSAFLSAYPEGGSPTTSWMNYITNDIKANAGIVAINQATNNFSIYVQSTTNVLVDVFGVFLPPQATALDCFDTTKVTTTLPASGNITVIANACPAGYTPTGGSCFGGAGESRALEESVLNVNSQWFCRWQDYGGVAVEVAATNRCCRVPGR